MLREEEEISPILERNLADQEHVLSGTVSVAEILAFITQDTFMTVSQAAAYLGLSPRFIRKRLASIPHYRVAGRKILFKRSELNQWMRQWQKRDSSLDEAMKIVDQILESEGEA